jgi:hypothetical protein
MGTCRAKNQVSRSSNRSLNRNQPLENLNVVQVLQRLVTVKATVLRVRLDGAPDQFEHGPLL